jgi:GH25 family lysozyme M1 (1,4-beta-N-acetylmuramidase)
MLRFMDVSGHQGHVDYARARRTPANPAGVDGVLVKLTEGADWRDPEGAANMAGAKRAGVPRGPYHYLRPRTDRNGATEARHAVAVAKELGWNPGRRGVWRNRDLPMSCDVEWENNVPQLTALGPVRAWEYVSDFCDEVKRLSGRGCVFYSAPGFMPLIGGRAPRNASLAWIADPDSPDGRPRILAGFRPGHVRFHQTDFHGVVPGVGAHVDLDVFLGGQVALRALIAGVPVPTAPKPKPAPKPKVPADTLGVREVQQLLKRCGWPITVDGIRGRQTMLAVRDFQRGYGRERLAVDGKIGARTGASRPGGRSACCRASGTSRSARRSRSTATATRWTRRRRSGCPTRSRGSACSPASGTTAGRSSCVTWTSGTSGRTRRAARHRGRPSSLTTSRRSSS